jgi:AcrR family transcriptional regulator
MDDKLNIVHNHHKRERERCSRGKMNVVQKNSKKSSVRIDRDTLRERALAAARRILQEEGLKGLNARRLATEIGVAVGTLYNLFENFEEIILRLNLETLQEMEAHFVAQPALPKDPVAAMLGIAREYLAFTDRNRNRWAATLEFKSAAPHGFTDEFPATVSRLVAEVERAMAPLFPPGSESERRLAAAVLWTSMEGISTLSAADNLRMVAPTTAWDMAQSLIVNYMAGLKQTRR